MPHRRRSPVHRRAGLVQLFPRPRGLADLRSPRIADHRTGGDVLALARPSPGEWPETSAAGLRVGGSKGTRPEQPERQAPGQRCVYAYNRPAAFRWRSVPVPRSGLVPDQPRPRVLEPRWGWWLWRATDETGRERTRWEACDRRRRRRGTRVRRRRRSRRQGQVGKPSAAAIDATSSSLFDARRAAEDATVYLAPRAVDDGSELFVHARWGWRWWRWWRRSHGTPCPQPQRKEVALSAEISRQEEAGRLPLYHLGWGGPGAKDDDPERCRRQQQHRRWRRRGRVQTVDTAQRTERRAGEDQRQQQDPRQFSSGCRRKCRRCRLSAAAAAAAGTTAAAAAAATRGGNKRDFHSLLRAEAAAAAAAAAGAARGDRERPVGMVPQEVEGHGRTRLSHGERGRRDTAEAAAVFRAKNRWSSPVEERPRGSQSGGGDDGRPRPSSVEEASIGRRSEAIHRRIPQGAQPKFNICWCICPSCKISFMWPFRNVYTWSQGVKSLSPSPFPLCSSSVKEPDFHYTFCLVSPPKQQELSLKQNIAFSPPFCFSHVFFRLTRAGALSRWTWTWKLPVPPSRRRQPTKVGRHRDNGPLRGSGSNSRTKKRVLRFRMSKGVVQMPAVVRSRAALASHRISWQTYIPAPCPGTLAPSHPRSATVQPPRPGVTGSGRPSPRKKSKNLVWSQFRKACDRCTDKKVRFASVSFDRSIDRSVASRLRVVGRDENLS